MFDNQFRNKKILVTGHTGFKGAWLCSLLEELGAEVIGISDQVRPSSLYARISHGLRVRHFEADIRDFHAIETLISRIRPDGIFHLAAQPIVLESYAKPIETFDTNILGTANVIKCGIQNRDLKFILVVTSDKVYMNDENRTAFKENDPLGGDDPYSASKAAAEMVVNSMRYLLKESPGTNLITARAGNVIGGGDDADFRIIPDVVHGLQNISKIEIRNPDSVRPWQHVLDPLWGYVLIGNKSIQGKRISNSYNFGPKSTKPLSVLELTKAAINFWESNSPIVVTEINEQKEAKFLQIDSSLAEQELDWKTKYLALDAIKLTIEWEKFVFEGHVTELEMTKKQISKYINEEI